MNSINIYENKTLKLQNVIVRRLDLESDDQNLFDSEINKIKYIHTDAWSKPDRTVNSIFKG